jgi:hypothetical protein
MLEPELKLVADPEPGSPAKKFIVAGVIMLVVAVAVFVFNPWKTAEFTITKAEVYAPHTEFQQLKGGMHVLSGAPAAEDDLYIVATVRIVDKLRLPLFINDCTALLLNRDGTQLNATAISSRDLARLEQTFPALAPMAQHPLDEKTPIAPGETREGTIVLQFPGLTAAAWNAKKSASLTLNLTHQGPQVVPFPAQ